jgi:creatinine amidohydrolase
LIPFDWESDQRIQEDRMKTLSKAMSKRFLPYLSSPEIEQIKKEEAIVILPMASVEQHGPHLPVFTDSLLAEEIIARICNRLDDEIPIWLLPILAYGRSCEHDGFAGTISLTSETLMCVLNDIAAGLAGNGFKRFVILNTHGGNHELIDVCMRDIRKKFGLLVFGLHMFLRVGLAKEGLSNIEHMYGIHAGDIETSILLSIHPEMVKMELACETYPLHLIDQNIDYSDPINFAWLTVDITQSGVMGNATTADAERGEIYLENAVDETITILNKIKNFHF